MSTTAGTWSSRSSPGSRSWTGVPVPPSWWSTTSTVRRALGPAAVHPAVRRPGTAPDRLGHLDLGAGMSGGEMTGVDLAQVASRAAMEQARKNGGGQKAKQKPGRSVRCGATGASRSVFEQRSAPWLPSGPGSSRPSAPRCGSGGRPSPPALPRTSPLCRTSDSGRLTVCPESTGDRHLRCGDVLLDGGVVGQP